MNDQLPVFLSYDEAIQRLPDGASVHTFRQGGGMLFGADWSRDGILEALRQAPEIQEAGDMACSMKHGLVIEDHSGALFIETKT